MKQRILFVFAFTLLAKFSFGQLIDRFGINFGTSYSTQIWDYKLMHVANDNEYKLGFLAFFHAEKDLGNLLAFRTEIGYIQKGFKNNIELIFEDGTSAGTDNATVILHDLALNIGLKVKPLKADYSPYLLVGLRGDYLVSYKDTEFEELGSGLKFSIYESTIKMFNKFNLGGLAGLGIDIKDSIFFEIEFNPNFTKNLYETGLEIKDNCWEAKIGLNLNKLVK